MDLATADLIKQTWDECGWTIRPLRRLVFVRLEKRPEIQNGVLLLPKYSATYGESLAPYFYAMVLAVGPQAKDVRPGDRILMSRIFFAWWKRLETGTYVGWLEEENIAGIDMDSRPSETDVITGRTNPFFPMIEEARELL
jgi:hypothetical protein